MVLPTIAQSIFFASEKSRLFGDAHALQRTTGVSDPRLHKSCGRVPSVALSQPFGNVSGKISF